MNARISEILALRMAWLGDVVKPSRIAGKLARFFLGGILLAHLLLFLVILAASLVLLHANPKVTALMVWRDVTAHQKAQPVHYVPLQRIPLVVRRMVIRLEDYSFYRNIGIDPGAIRDAYLTNRAIGYPLYGGSTIAQQLARNLFLTPRKTYARKYAEALIAVEMDMLMPKNRILELYLNCIEWGKGVYGIGAASYHYYGTNVASLSLDELRRLVTIITNPLRFNVNTFDRSRQMRERYEYLLGRFPDPTTEPTEPGPYLVNPYLPMSDTLGPTEPGPPPASDQSTATIQMPVPPAPGL